MLATRGKMAKYKINVRIECKLQKYVNKIINTKYKNVSRPILNRPLSHWVGIPISTSFQFHLVSFGHSPSLNPEYVPATPPSIRNRAASQKTLCQQVRISQSRGRPPASLQWTVNTPSPTSPTQTQWSSRKKTVESG